VTTVNGFTISPFIQKQILKAARRYNQNPALLAAQIQIESGFNPGATSSAAAGGLSQFIPSTAQQYGVQYGTSKAAQKSQIMGQAHYMSDLGARRGDRQSFIQATGGYYGALDPAYYQKILDAAKGYKGLFAGGLPPGGGGKGGAGAQMPDSAGAGPNLAQTMFDPMSDPTVRLNEVLSNLSPSTSGGKQSAQLEQGWELLSAIAQNKAAQKFESQMAQLTSAARTKMSGKGAKGGGAEMAMGKGKGKVVLSAGADRAGTDTSGAVLRFVRQISALAGEPLTIGTGTNHSQMTVSGNVSDHWSGHAADIPAAGKELIMLGRMALIAAGMSRKQAMQQDGGLYNVGGHQIIFNTYEGGDHTDHLHVSAY